MRLSIVGTWLLVLGAAHGARAQGADGGGVPAPAGESAQPAPDPAPALEGPAQQDALVTASAPQAQVPPVMVRAGGCAGLDAAEVARILGIELSLLGEDVGRVHAPTVEVTCSPRWVRLSLYDRETGGYLDRVVPAPDPGDAGRERVVALAASQLVAAWLPGARRARSPPQSQPASVVEEPPPPTTGASSEIGLRGGARARSLGSRSSGMAAAGLALGLSLSRGLKLRAALEVAHGQVSRTPGHVDLDSAGLGFGVGWELARGPVLGWQAGAMLYGVFAKLEGEAAPGFREARPSTDALALDVELSFGPMLHHGPLGVGLVARGGVALAEREAQIENDDPVGIGGPWLGADLVFRFELGSAAP